MKKILYNKYLGELWLWMIFYEWIQFIFYFIHIQT
jgi:hypothetical protein